jgi:hypothetical protein
MLGCRLARGITDELAGGGGPEALEDLAVAWVSSST